MSLILIFASTISKKTWQKYNLPISDIYYDLSYSQGSGASFETDEIQGVGLEKFIKKTFPNFAKSFRFGLFNENYLCWDIGLPDYDIDPGNNENE